MSKSYIGLMGEATGPFIRAMGIGCLLIALMPFAAVFGVVLVQEGSATHRSSTHSWGIALLVFAGLALLTSIVVLLRALIVKCATVGVLLEWPERKLLSGQFVIASSVTKERIANGLVHSIQTIKNVSSVESLQLQSDTGELRLRLGKSEKGYAPVEVELLIGGRGWPARVQYIIVGQKLWHPVWMEGNEHLLATLRGLGQLLEESRDFPLTVKLQVSKQTTDAFQNAVLFGLIGAAASAVGDYMKHKEVSRLISGTPENEDSLARVCEAFSWKLEIL